MTRRPETPSVIGAVDRDDAGSGHAPERGWYGMPDRPRCARCDDSDTQWSDLLLAFARRGESFGCIVTLSVAALSCLPDGPMPRENR